MRTSSRTSASFGRAFAAVLLASSCFTPAFAQNASNEPVAKAGEIETVVVTARKRAEDIQSVPLAISALGGNELVKKQVVSLRDLVSNTPSLSYAENSSRNSNVVLRGTNTSTGNYGLDSPVGVFFDGVYQQQATGLGNADFLDLEAVEVLRGPQAVLFGRNTPVGAINVRTRPAQQDFEAMIQAGVGNFDTRYFRGYVGGGITDNLAGRISFFTNTHGGYDYNLANNRRTNDDDRWGVRVNLKFTPSDNFTSTLISYFYRDSHHCCVADQTDPNGQFGIFALNPNLNATFLAATGRPYLNTGAKDHIVDDPTDAFERIDQGGVTLNNQLGLPGDHTLTAVSAYTYYGYNSPTLYINHQPVNAVSYGPIKATVNTYQQELRITSPSGGMFEYLVGGFYYHQSTDKKQTVEAMPAATRILAGNRFNVGDVSRSYFRMHADSAAAFGQLTWNITSQLHATGGVRYTHDKKTGANVVLAPYNLVTGGPASAMALVFPANAFPNLHTSSNNTSYVANLGYDVTSDVHAYASFSTGYQAGGFSGESLPLVFAAGQSPIFQPMTVKNYEIGVKSILFDRRLRLNFDVFEMKVNKFQDSVRIPGNSAFVVANSSNRRNRGVEFDGTANLTDEFSISFQGAYQDNRITSYPAGPCAAVGPLTPGTLPGTCNYTGTRAHFSPEFSGSISPEWQHPLGRFTGFIGGSLAYTSWQYTDPSHDPRGVQPGYALLSLRAGVMSDDEHWKVQVYCKNCTDKGYALQTSSASLGALIGQLPTYTTGLVGEIQWIGPPRTVGVEASYKF